MTTLGCLLVAAIVLSAQFAHARWLDGTLPKRKKLPVWSKFGAHMANRRTALNTHPYFSVLLEAALLVSAVLHDLDDRPVRSTIEMIVAFAFVSMLGVLVNAINVWKLKRWFRAGEPKIGG